MCKPTEVSFHAKILLYEKRGINIFYIFTANEKKPPRTEVPKTLSIRRKMKIIKSK
jgi:hypothetical protein